MSNESNYTNVTTGGFGLWEMVARSEAKMLNSAVAYKFRRVADRVKALHPRVERRNGGVNQLDGMMVRAAIDDVKLYMRTLTGDEKLSWSGKDRLPIRVRVLIERLYSIEVLVDAIEACQSDPNKEIELFDAYELLKQNIEYGVIQLSNLEFLVKRSLAGNIPAIPNHFICPISLQLMQNPVIASDGFNYEESEIRDHIRLHGGFGRAVSPKNPGHILIGSVNPDTRLLREIESFLRKYPIYNSERYQVEESHRINSLPVVSAPKK